MTTDFDIVIPGHYFCDVIFTHMHDFPILGGEIYSEGVQVVPGGGALNTAIGLNRLSIKAGWAGVLGTDFFSQYVSNYIQREKLNTGLVQHLEVPLQRVTVALSYPTDRAFITYAEKPPEIIELTKYALENARFRHLHFSGLVIHEELPELLKVCKQKGISTSMECQHRDDTLDTPLVRSILSNVDIFMPNAIEARRITQSETLTQAIDVLSQIVGGVVVKNGAEGAIAQFGTTNYYARPYTVTPIDTTGAGDVFNAGFLAAYLQNHPIKTCLRWGNYCGSQSTLGYGASNAPTSIPEEV